MASSIEWLNGGETWNPIKARRKTDGKKGWACVRVSPGCEHCYSEAQNVQCGANRTRHGTGLKYTVPALDQVELYLDEEVLMQPLHWKKPRLIFPCSMTDWMADFVPDEWRDKMLAVMAMTPQHTYLTLTKRADRQREYMSDPETRRRVGIAIVDIALSLKVGSQGLTLPIEHRPDSTEAEPRLWANWPVRNLWLGVSAEDQKRADERITQLLQTPAAVRWVSAEPLLEAIDFRRLTIARKYVGPHASVPIGWLDVLEIAWQCSYCREYFSGGLQKVCPSCGKEGGWSGSHAFNPPGRQVGSGIDWCVVGGESGPGARPMNTDWVSDIVTQCQAANVPVFVKQLGTKPYLHRQKSVHIEKPGMKLHIESLEIESTLSLKHPKGGDISEWPEDLRVREYPEAANGGT